LSGAFTDSIIIENTIYPLTVTGTAISFPLVGEAEDVTLFWELVREREYESGTTIYDYFINHGGVPANVNPMLFFLQHVFANRAVVIGIKETCKGDNAIADAAAILLWAASFLLSPKTHLFILAL